MIYELQPLLRTAALAVLVAIPVPAMAQVALLMGEEEGCIWCARWDAEVGDAYAKTAEGRAAPLRRVDIHDPLPDDIRLTSRMRFTPTFVLLHDGQEVARREGYPGEDFFWPVLGQMLDAAAEDIPELDGWRDGR
ncbi:hypothetical protein JANAI62_34460 [Jannaschia pagri]|uniref:Regulatory protein SoxS n=1 Tax=Jannaschia pagri TaxID=2829797 RepID=A0ABQ4NQY8_9RHOB|nr:MULTISPECIES: hypothetical protein [unclassified Jannaschia]GIT92988.1 hypothetical protein JANAI61_34460 [Jannaschia sp. AI_61]GIT96823.1 hypothetical protein JANAI62_34460 [Jannaschia sp. AI_62]